MSKLPADLFAATTPPAVKRGKAARKSKATRKTRPPAPTRGRVRKPATPPTTTAQGGYRKPTELAPRPRPTGRRPAADLDGQPPVRVTIYLRPDQFLRLRKAAAARPRGDVSMLVREAVDVFLPPKS